MKTRPGIERRSHPLAVAGATALAVALLFVHSAPAATIQWTNTSDGVYSVGANWRGGSPPSPTDNASFTNPASYQVTWSADATVANAAFGAPDGTVTLDAGSSTWMISGQAVVGTNGALATVLLTNGTVKAGSTRIGSDAAGARGRLTVSGAGTLYTNAAALRVGTVGSWSNDLVITGGAKVHQGGVSYVGDNSRGSRLIVSGEGSQFVASDVMRMGTAVGYYPDNGIIVSNKGLFSSPLTLYLGPNAPYDVRERFMVTGTGSVATVRYIFMQGDEHQITVSDGGVLRMPYGTDIKSSSGGGQDCKVLVTGRGSELSVTNYSWWLASAGTKNCEYAVRNGGMMQTTGAFAMTIDGNGTRLIVSDPGSIVRAGGGLYTRGAPGSAPISIVVSNGGTLISKGGLALPETTGNGPVSVLVSGAGSMFSNALYLVAGNWDKSDTTITVDGGGRFYTRGMAPSPVATGIARFAGSTGVVHVAGNGSLWRDPGTVQVCMAPGADGTVRVSDGGTISLGHLTATNGAVLAFAAGATNAGAMNVSGTLKVDATSKLSIDMANYARKGVPGPITLLSYGSMPVQFAEGNITITGVPPGKGTVDQVTGNKITYFNHVSGTVVQVR